MPLVALKNLSINYGDRPVVRNLSLTLEEGQTLGLVGESGSGKSTIALALMGLLAKNASLSGEILWQGMPAAGRRNAAMIFQEPMTALNPSMTIGKQVAEALAVCQPTLTAREQKRQTIAALDQVAIPEPDRRYNDYPHQFSGGQRQRILISMALVQRPRLLIADEPTTALDVTIQAQILTLMRQLQRDLGLAMLFISHDLAVVGQMANQISVLKGGELVESAPAHTLLTAPQHPYTQTLLNAVPTMRTDRSKPLPMPVA